MKVPDAQAQAAAKVAEWFRPLHAALDRAEATADRCRAARERLAETRRKLKAEGLL